MGGAGAYPLRRRAPTRGATSVGERVMGQAHSSGWQRRGTAGAGGRTAVTLALVAALIGLVLVAVPGTAHAALAPLSVSPAPVAPGGVVTVTGAAVTCASPSDELLLDAGAVAAPRTVPQGVPISTTLDVAGDATEGPHRLVARCLHYGGGSTEQAVGWIVVGDGGPSERSGIFVLTSYLRFPGTSSSLGNVGAVTGQPVADGTDLPADLSGLQLVAVPARTRDVTPAEADRLAAYVAGGGRLLVMADGPTVTSEAADDLLGRLGVGIGAVPGSFDGGYHETVDVVPDPLTAGVGLVGYAWTSDLRISGTARPLVYGQSGQLVMAADALGAGLVVATSDHNLFVDSSDVWTRPDFDNALLAHHVVLGGDGALPVCEGDPDLVVTAAIDPGTVPWVGSATVDATVENRGPCQVWAGAVGVEPSSGLVTTMVAEAVDGRFDPARRTWNLPPLAPGATASATIRVTATDRTVPGDHVVALELTRVGYPADPTPDGHRAELGLTVQAPPPGSVSATLSADGVPVAGAFVLLRSPNVWGVPTGFAVSDDDGRVRFDDVAQGSYRMRVVDLEGRYRSGWAHRSGPTLRVDGLTRWWGSVLQVRSGTELALDVDLLPRPDGVLRGDVVGEDGAPLPDRVWVQVFAPGWGFVRGGVTGPGGGFELRGLPPGRYLVRFVDLSDGRDEWYLDGAMVAVSDAEPTEIGWRL